jgi:predicted Zn-dependent protease
MRPQQIVEHVQGRSSCDATVVIVQEQTQANLRWAGNTLTTNGVVRGTQVTVVAIDERTSGAAAGVVTRSVSELPELTELVEAADAAARAASPAPDAAPLDGGATAQDWDEPSPEASATTLADLARGLGRAFEQADAQDRELFGFAEQVLETTYLATSAGTTRRHTQPTGKLEMTGKSAGRQRSSWVGRYTTDFADIDLPELDAELGRRLAWEDRRVSLPPGRYDVLLPPSAVSDFMVYLYWELAARDAAEGRTAFSRPGGGTRVGDRLTSAPVQLVSDPEHPKLRCQDFVSAHASWSMGSVFDNGLPLQRTEWVRDGVLEQLVTTRHSARETGLAFAPPIDNLVLRVGDSAGGLDDLVARTERGLLLTTLWYIREVDAQSLLLTGLTRDGVYLVEDGAVVAAVNNFRFNESPVDLLGRIADAGEAVTTLPREWSDYFTRVAMAPLRVSGFNMSTVSQAS